MANDSNAPDDGGSVSKGRKKKPGTATKRISSQTAAAARDAANNSTTSSRRRSTSKAAKDAAMKSASKAATATENTPPVEPKHKHPHYTFLAQVVGIIAGAASIFGAGFAVSDYSARLHEFNLEKTHSDELKNVKTGLVTVTAERDRFGEQLTELQKSAKFDVVEGYLRRVVADSTTKGKWEGFEANYARATLYLLKATDVADKYSSPTEVYGRIVRWRLGVDLRGAQDVAAQDLDPQDEVLLSLTGYAYDAEPWGGTSAAEYVHTHVDQLLYDRDLLDCKLDFRGEGQKGILVLGEPAAGKSWLLNYLRLEAARRALADADAPIPVRVDLDDLDKSKPITKEAIWEKVDELTTDPKDPEAGPLQLPPDRRYLLLLDALDEVARPDDAALAANEIIINDERVDRVIVTSRISNYSVLLHKGDKALTQHGYRMALLYGQDFSSVERRVLACEEFPRGRLLEVLSDTPSRPVWMQFFRLPSNFNFAKEVAEQETLQLQQAIRTELFKQYITNRLERVREELNADVEQPSRAEDLLADIAGILISESEPGTNAKFTFDHAKKAYKGSAGEISPNVKKQAIQKLLDLVRKAGIIVSREEDQYEFRHMQFLEYYASRCDDIDWKTVPLSNVAWKEVLLFKTSAGGADAKELILRMAAEGQQQPVPTADNPHNDKTVDLVTLAVECIDTGPYKDDQELKELKRSLEELLIARRGS